MTNSARVSTRLLALALCGMCGVTLARVVAYDEVAFSTVTALQTCGRWEVDGQSGEFRVVQAYFYGGTMLFVDMVRPNESGNWYDVFRGYTFDELTTITTNLSCHKSAVLLAGLTRLRSLALQSRSRTTVLRSS